MPEILRSRRRRTVWIGTAFGCLALVGCSSGGGVQTAPKRAEVIGDGLIVPGERIGGIRLGMTTDQVLVMLGRPEKVVLSGKGGSAGSTYWWSDNNLIELIDFSPIPVQEATQISTHSESFHTKEGFGVGNGGKELVGAYGPHYCTDHQEKSTGLAFNTIGLWFGLNISTNRAYQVSVHAPRNGC